MTSKPLYLLTDEPIRHHHQDGLGMGEYANVIARTALDTPGPFTIGVFAEWGQGKTSLLRAARSLVDEARQADVVTVWFDAWLHESDDEPIVPLIGTIVAGLEQDADRAGVRASLASALRSVAYGMSFKLRLGVVELGFSGKDAAGRRQQKQDAKRAETAFDRQSIYLEAFERLERLTHADASPQLKIVVFIDDLDRCLPDNAVRLLESLKLVLAQPGFVFVLAVDRDVVQRYLAKRFRDSGVGADARTRSTRYLHKIVQLPLDLPSHEGARFETFVDHIKTQEAVAKNEHVAKAFEGLDVVLGAGVRYNPRALVRLVNNLIVDQHTWVAKQDRPHESAALLGLTAVARLLQEQLDLRDYRRLVNDIELCEELYKAPEKRRVAVLDRLDAGPLLKSLIDAGLEPLLGTDAGKAWLIKHADRNSFDRFLSPSDEWPIFARAINRALDRRTDEPVAKEDYSRVTKLDLSGRRVTDVGLSNVRRLPNLASLNLSETEITDAGLHQLSDLTNLTNLYLADTGITDRGLYHLQRLNLIDLALTGNTSITDAGLPQLHALKDRLTRIVLYGTAVTDEGLSHLRAFEQLEYLSLGSTAITGDGLSHLQTLTNLRTLNLSGASRITDNGLHHLRALTNLTTLDLGDTGITDDGLHHLRALTNLTTLTLWGDGITEDGVAALRAALPDLEIRA